MTSNPGWADALQKVLKTQKPKKKKTIVLSKAKKYNDTVKVKKEKETLSFEIEQVHEESDTNSETENVKTTESKENNVSVIKRKHRKKDNLGIRVKPSITDREREKILQKIATKGVVQLFNAVRQQQVETNQKLLDSGPLERKREQVLKNIDKRAFLDTLMGETKSIPVDSNVQQNDEEDVNNEEKDNVWSVLRDNFVMGARLKDWDKNQEENEDSSTPEDMDSDE